MDLTTELLDNAAFREAKRNGYNTQDVDEFIEQVKVEYGRHEALVRESRQRADAAEARVLEAEHRAAEATERAAAASEADETLKRTLVLAQRTADAAIKDAEEQASRTLTTAQDQAARLLADAQESSARARAEAETEARQAQEDARARVLAELHDLEAARDQLRADVDDLEGHLGQQRDRVRVATQELQRLLDDPNALREVATPVLAEVVVPASEPSETVEPAPDLAPEDDLDVAPDDEPEVQPEVEPEREPELGATEGAPADDTGDDAPDAAAPPATPPASAAHADPVDEGPDTEAVDLSGEPNSEDDAYLAELRKAMTDESPLGPRDDDEAPTFEPAEEPPRSRFGRRR